jgi:hypothetical protein
MYSLYLDQSIVEESTDPKDHPNPLPKREMYKDLFNLYNIKFSEYVYLITIFIDKKTFDFFKGHESDITFMHHTNDLKNLKNLEHEGHLHVKLCTKLCPQVLFGPENSKNQFIKIHNIKVKYIIETRLESDELIIFRSLEWSSLERNRLTEAEKSRISEAYKLFMFFKVHWSGSIKLGFNFFAHETKTILFIVEEQDIKSIHKFIKKQGLSEKLKGLAPVHVGKELRKYMITNDQRLDRKCTVS